MEQDYELQIRENWQITSLFDFVENVDSIENFEKFLNKEEFNRESCYLELSVKIKTR